MDVKELRLRQVERATDEAAIPPRPRAGWIQTIRSALGMTTRQLAGRLSVSQSTLAALEKSEAEERITLQSLRRVAEALDCDLKYTLVPRTPLRQRVHERADAIARERAARVLHTMRLEDQAPGDELNSEEIQKIRRSLLDRSWKHLWD
ncbi:mobile mystery protein A [Oxalobacteraceae bacterium A2-2]